MNIVYRLLGLIINIVASLLAVSLLFSIPMLLSSPITMLSGFLMIAVILYSWFSFQFRRQVLQQRQVVNHTLRDWVRVNGIVTLVFSFLTISSVVPLIQDPQAFTDAIKGMGYNAPIKNLNALFYVMLCYAIVLFIHIFWTFTLMKKHEEFFQ